MPGKILGLIPARGGSKGVPGKNTRHLGGRPLIEYTIEAARLSNVVDRLVVSTDSEAIADVARSLGADVPFMRPSELAGDRAAMLPVIQHAVSSLSRSGWRADIVLVLQPTSPLRQPQHLVEAVTILSTTEADAVVSVVEVPLHMSPDYVMRIDDGRLLSFLPEGAGITRRQDARPAFIRDGTVYACRERTLSEQNSLYGRDCRPLLIRAADSITIDTLEDWQSAEQRLAERASSRADLK